MELISLCCAELLLYSAQLYSFTWVLVVHLLLVLLLAVYPGLNLLSVQVCLWWQADRERCSQQLWRQPLAKAGGGDAGRVCSILSQIKDWGLRAGVVVVCGSITECVRLCLSVHVGGQMQQSLQRLTFPSFRGPQLQVIPCATVGIKISSRDPTLLLLGADKPPTCGKIQRLRVYNKHVTQCIEE